MFWISGGAGATIILPHHSGPGSILLSNTIKQFVLIHININFGQTPEFSDAKHKVTLETNWRWRESNTLEEGWKELYIEGYLLMIYWISVSFVIEMAIFYLICAGLVTEKVCSSQISSNCIMLLSINHLWSPAIYKLTFYMLVFGLLLESLSLYSSSKVHWHRIIQCIASILAWADNKSKSHQILFTFQFGFYTFL